MSSDIPFSEPPWHTQPSSIYKETHRKWQKTCREFIDKNLIQHALEWEKQGEVPPAVWQTFARHNFLVPAIHPPLPVDWLRKLGLDTLPGGLTAADYDFIHWTIYFDEMSRSGLLGVSASITTGLSIGLNPFIGYGSPELQAKVLPDLLTGKTRCCLAVTEPDAGSDVANLQTVAARSSDGKHFLVNGTKKWITNAIWSEWSCMVVRTGGPGASGLSLLAVPLKDTPGVSMRKLQTTGQATTGTTYIELDDVKVPVENIIGQEGAGMKMVMSNFNPERIMIAVTVVRQARVALSAAFQYCLKREAFGKTLMDQPVVRHRLAKCGAELEAVGAWVEQLVYSMTQLDKKEADKLLGGVTALLKAQSTRVLTEVANTAVLVLGGAGFTKGGQGDIIEHIYREVGGSRIPGGSEDVLLDLGVRQLVKLYNEKQGNKPKI